MNKSNGGKQRHRHDTIIPQSNPSVEHRGKIQKMTLPDGRPKGLQQVLEERGFDVCNLLAKCAPVMSAHGKAPIVAWLVFSASRRTLQISHQCSRL
jgi:hypothetical protein